MSETLGHTGIWGLPIAQGKGGLAIAYVSQVVGYFEALGFVCPANKEVAEFLQEVTLPAGILKYVLMSGMREGGRIRPLRPLVSETACTQGRGSAGLGWDTASISRQGSHGHGPYQVTGKFVTKPMSYVATLHLY